MVFRSQLEQAELESGCPKYMSVYTRHPNSQVNRPKTKVKYLDVQFGDTNQAVVTELKLFAD